MYVLAYIYGIKYTTLYGIKYNTLYGNGIDYFTRSFGVMRMLR